MTGSSEFKGLVRERMQATGEKYTTAMRVILKAAETGVSPLRGPDAAILPRIAAQYPDGRGEVYYIRIWRTVRLYVSELRVRAGGTGTGTRRGRL
jgi:hypothetical protein